jgi:hypothetical protein
MKSRNKKTGKKRQHLPKVGSEADLRWEREEGTAHLEHPFSDDPSSRTGFWAAIVGIIVVVLLIIGALGWLILT